MTTTELCKDVAQILYYLALSITGPLALIGYLRAQKTDREQREYRTFDELDNKLLEYHKLALQHDLDLIDVPDLSPVLAGDRLRKKQELVACTLAFSLFQRAYLMFHGQSDQFKKRQWAGWEEFLTRFLVRDSVKDCWQVSRAHLDTDFQRYIDGKIAADLRQSNVDPVMLYAFERTGFLVRDHNEHLFDAQQLAAFRAAAQEYQQKRAA